MENFSETITYVCCSVLELRDQSGDSEVAREIYFRVGQGSEPKGSALKLRNVFIKKFSNLLCNVATLTCNLATLRKSEISALCNVATLETQFLANLGKVAMLDFNVVTLKFAPSGTSRRWKPDPLECHDVGSQCRDIENMTLLRIVPCKA